MLFGKPSILGIDIGTTSIKIIELQKESGRIKLKNYGEYYSSSKRELIPVKADFLSFFEEGIANIIRGVLTEAKIRTKDAVLSLPVFSSFFTLVELPLMEPKEIPEAIKFQAHRYIPVPIEEVVLNWILIEEEKMLLENRIQVLLVAVPRDVIEKYMRIGKILGLNVKALEIESFAEARALTKEDEGPIVIVNIGGRITNVTVVDKGFIRVCHNLDLSSFNLIRTLSQRLNVSFERAEELQKTKGLLKEIDSLVAPILTPVVDKIIFGVEGAINLYLSKNPQKKIQKVILSGGTANMPGLLDYFSEKLSKKVERANPFSNILFPPVLKEVVEAISPSFSVAVGLALREFIGRK